MVVLVVIGTLFFVCRRRSDDDADDDGDDNNIQNFDEKKSLLLLLLLRHHFFLYDVNDDVTNDTQKKRGVAMATFVFGGWGSYVFSKRRRSLCVSKVLQNSVVSTIRSTSGLRTTQPRRLRRRRRRDGAEEI